MLTGLHQTVKSEWELVPRRLKVGLVASVVFCVLFWSISTFLRRTHEKQDRTDWQEAVSHDTPESYLAYMETHSEGTWSEEADHRLHELLSWEWACHFNSILYLRQHMRAFPGGRFAAEAAAKLDEREVVRIVTSQTYTDATDQTQDLTRIDIAGPARALLEAAGFKVREDPSERYDATLEVAVWGSPQGSWYHSRNRTEPTWYWSGAHVSGTVSLSGLGLDLPPEEFEGELEPGFLLSAWAVNNVEIQKRYWSVSPAGAPYSLAFLEPFVSTLVEILASRLDIEHAILLARAGDFPEQLKGLTACNVPALAESAIVRRATQEVPALLAEVRNTTRLMRMGQFHRLYDRPALGIVRALAATRSPLVVQDLKQLQEECRRSDHEWLFREVEAAIARLSELRDGKEPIEAVE